MAQTQHYNIGKDPFQEEADAQEEEDIREADAVTLLGCLPPMESGHLVAFLTFLEAMFILFSLKGIGSYGYNHGYFEALRTNPMRSLMVNLLWAVTFGDFFFSAVGCLGIWMSHNRVPLELRNLWHYHSFLTGSFVGSLLCWRCLVIVGSAPFSGIMFAFSDADSSLTLNMWVMMSFFAVQLYTVYMLIQTYRWAVVHGKRTQDELEILFNTCRKQLVHDAHRAGYPEGSAEDLTDEHPYLFGFLPLEMTVGVYAFIILVACFVGFVELCTGARSVGGWAFFMKQGSNVTFWLEFVVYFFGWASACLGLAAIIYYQGARDLELFMIESQEDDEEMREVHKLKRRSTLIIISFLLFSVMRCAFFIPISAMTLLTNDLCGLYLQGLTQLELWYGSRFMIPMHCGAGDAWAFIGTLIFATVDCTMVYGVAELWHRYRQWNRTKPINLAKLYGAYGEL